MKKQIAFFLALTVLLVQAVTGATLPNLTDLPAITDDDLFYVVDNPSGTPADRKSTAAVVATHAIGYDAEISALSGLTSAANKLPYFTGSGTAALTDLSAFSRTFLDDADEATFKATVNLEIGTDVQAYNAQLANLANQAVYNGADTAALTNLVYVEIANLNLSGVGIGNDTASLTNFLAIDSQEYFIQASNIVDVIANAVADAGAETSGTVHSGGDLITDNALVTVNGTVGTNVQQEATVLFDSGVMNFTDAASITNGVAADFSTVYTEKIDYWQAKPNVVHLGNITTTATLTGTNSTFTANFTDDAVEILLPGSPSDGWWTLHFTNSYGVGEQIVTVPSLIREEYDPDTAITSFTNAASSGSLGTVTFKALAGAFRSFSVIGDQWQPAAAIDLSGVNTGASTGSITNLVALEVEDDIWLRDGASLITLLTNKLTAADLQAVLEFNDLGSITNALAIDSAEFFIGASNLVDVIADAVAGVSAGDHSGEVDFAGTGNVTNLLALELEGVAYGGSAASVTNFVAAEFEDDIWIRDGATLITELTNKLEGITAAMVGATSANLDDTDASIEWEDAADLDANGAVNDDVIVTGWTLGAAEATTINVSSTITNGNLTATRVVFAGADKTLVDDSDMTFATDTLTVTKLVGSTSVTTPTAALATANIGTGTVTNNVFALLSVGDTTFVDLNKASQTNALSGDITFAHASNGVAGVHKSHVRWLISDAQRALSIPATWSTNLYSAVPAKITNGWITKMILESWGETGTAANQTNVFVSFEFYKNQ